MNTLDKPDQMAAKGDLDAGYNTFSHAKVNIIQTDQPQLLIDYLTSKGQRSVTTASCIKQEVKQY